MGDLYLASRARSFLENLQPSRTSAGVRKTLPKKELEMKLDMLCRIQGEEILNKLRDDARGLSRQMQANQAFEKLDQLIGAVLGTRDARSLQSTVAKARSLGKAFDPDRLSLFQTLHTELQQTVIPNRCVTPSSADTNRHIAFFEAYFSKKTSTF